jgi:hypothetical protein
MTVPGPRYTKDQLTSAVAQARTMADVLRALGVAPRGGNYETAWDRMRRWGIDGAHLKGATQREGWSVPDDELRGAVGRSQSLAEAQRILGRQPGGAGYRYLRARITDLRIDTSHMLGEGWRLGSKVPPVPARPIEEYLVVGRRYPSMKLRQRLIKDGLKLHQCESCLGETWMGQPIPLELDHINGDRWDNRLENLRLLCPNCHAQTDTYRGRNIGNYARR